MLPLRVTQIEQHRALQQNATKPYLPHFLPATKLLSEREFARANRQIADPLPDRSSRRDFTIVSAQNTCCLTQKNQPVLAKWAPTSNRKWPANRCYRKQITKPRLTEARTRLRETAFSCNSQISAVALGDQFMLHSEAPERPSQSSNLARPYGRS